jgi:hypothetical protein
MASLLDVFNASTRLASQGLDMYSREQKYHLDTELYKQAQELDRLQNQLAEDLAKPDETGQYQFLLNPDDYRKYVEKSLAEWKQNAVRAGNGSRYYNDNLNQIALQGQTAMGKKVYAAEAIAAKNQLFADYQTRITEVDNNGEPPEDNFSKKMALTIDYARKNGLDDIKFKNLVDGVYTQTFTSMLSPDRMQASKADNGDYLVYKPEELDDQINKIVSVFPGAEADRHIAGMRGAIDGARKEWLAAAQKKNYDNFRLEQDAFTLAVNRGDLVSAGAIAARNEKRQSDARGSNLYTPEMAASIMGWFNMPGSADGSGGGRGEKITSANALEIGKNIVRKLVAGEEIIEGRNLNLQDLSGAGNALLTSVAYSLGYDVESPDSKLHLETVSRTLFTALGEVINEPGNELWKASFEQVKNLRSLNHEVSKLYEKNPGALDAWLLVKYTDLMSSWDYRNGTAEDISTAVNEIGAQLIAVGNSEKMESKYFETDNKAAIGRAWKNFENNPIMVETDAHGNEVIVPSPDGRSYPEERRLIDAELRKVLQKELGVDSGRLTPVSRNAPLSEKGMNTHEKDATWDYQVDGGNKFLRVNPSTDPKEWTIQMGTKDGAGRIAWGEKQKLEKNHAVQVLLQSPPLDLVPSDTEVLEMLKKQNEPQQPADPEEEARRDLERVMKQFDAQKERERRSRGPLR